MGLDILEFVMEVEAAFGIAIPDEDASRIVTVGDLYRDVLSRLPAGGMRRCASAAAFYRVRRTLIERCGIDRGIVRPSTPTATLIPEADRRSAWSDLGVALDWRMPPLVRPAWLQIAIAGLALSSVPASCVAFGQHSDLPAFLIAVAASALFVLILKTSVRLTTPLATQFPSNCETIQGTVQTILASNFAAIVSQVSTWDPREVWTILRTIISKQAGIPEDKIEESVEFVRDLGLD